MERMGYISIYYWICTIVLLICNVFTFQTFYAVSVLTTLILMSGIWDLYQKPKK
jgi:hypothetical protein